MKYLQIFANSYLITLIVIFAVILLSGCSTTANRLDRSYSHIRAAQSSTPACIWNNNCHFKVPGKFFTQLANSNK